MSLSSEIPGILPGWLCPGKKGTCRIVRSSKKFARRLKRRCGKKTLREDE